ncbi:MAG: hypothetical protein WCX12_01225 [Candidatus Paceibacterota bacterium]|jgi:hypothetical protein
MKQSMFEQVGNFNENRENVGLILSAAEKRPELDNFSDIFPTDEIKRDEQLLAAAKRNFSENEEHLTDEEVQKTREGKLRSEALEILVTNQAELNDWFGDNVLISRTTEFDDVINHVDAVLEFDLGEDNPETIALAVDASMRNDYHLTTSKIRRNIKSITGETRPTEVKYFESQIDRNKRSLRHIIPVVVGLEGNNCNQLFADFAQIIKLKRIPEKNGLQKETLHNLNEKMKTNPAQIAFLLEIQKQLEFYKNLVEKKTTEEGVNSKQLERLIGIIDSVLSEKKDIKLGELENDGVLKTIIQNTAVS